MIPPFANHPLVIRFNELKKYFRKFETPISRARVKEFRQFSKIISTAGLPVAFDFLGSVNFGQATVSSDVDVVLYITCENDYAGECNPENCRSMEHVKRLLLQTLVREYAQHPYEVEIVDAINLNQLNVELEKADPDSPVLIRFAFYRSICRNANAGLIRPFQNRLLANKELVAKMQPNLWTIFEGLVRSSQYTWSMHKYRERLETMGIRLPAGIIRRIHEHLDQDMFLGGEL